MKTITVEKEVKIPGTKIVLEAGDKIQIREVKYSELVAVEKEFSELMWDILDTPKEADYRKKFPSSLKPDHTYEESPKYIADLKARIAWLKKVLSA
jgi:hypothetical protein